MERRGLQLVKCTTKMSLLDDIGKVGDTVKCPICQTVDITLETESDVYSKKCDSCTDFLRTSPSKDVSADPGYTPENSEDEGRDSENDGGSAEKRESTSAPFGFGFNSNSKVTVTIREEPVIFTQWFNPIEGERPTSPLTFITWREKETMLHRTNAIAAVCMVKDKREWIARTRLRDRITEKLTSYFLALILRWKCMTHPLYIIVLDMLTGELEEWKGVDKLYSFVCDTGAEVEDMDAIEEKIACYIKPREWKEEGIVRRDGSVQRRFLMSNQSWADDPDEFDPG